MIDDGVPRFVIAGGQPSLRNRHADAVAETLPQRTCSYFYANGVPAFRMPWGFAAPLAKALQFFQGQIIAGQIKQAVEKHRPVARRKNKSVPVEPMRVLRVELQILCPQRIRHSGSAHGHPGMSRISFLYSIRREKPDCIDTEIFECLCFGSSHDFLLSSIDSSADQVVTLQLNLLPLATAEFRV